MTGESTAPVVARSSSSRFAGRGARALVVALTGALVLTGVWWWTHPNRFEDGGAGTFGMTVPSGGGSVVIGTWVEPVEGEVHLIQAEPVVAGDSTDGRVRVLMCHPRPGNGSLGTANGRAEQVCARTGEARDIALGQVDDGEPFMVVELTGREPGTLTVEGVRVRYRSGLRVGEQVVGARAVLRVGGD